MTQIIDSVESRHLRIEPEQAGVCQTTFKSVLFHDGRSLKEIEQATQPDVFIDLNLDQVIDALLRGRDEYELRPYFNVPLNDTRAILYRHEVMRDLERTEIMSAVVAFADDMRLVRRQLAVAAKMHYRWQERRYLLDGARHYGACVDAFADALKKAEPRSAGLRAFLDVLIQYAQSPVFRALVADESTIRKALDDVRYSVLIKGNAVTVRRYAGEVDYSEEVRRVFEKFKQGAVKKREIESKDYPDMNHVEATVMDFVARLYPEVFDPFETFCGSHADFIDPVIARFDREIQFYVAYLEHMTSTKAIGLSFCYPVLSSTSKGVRSVQGFDIALAEKLRAAKKPVVCNDFHLEGEERIIVITGPNQGGKTTFARAFGQLHYLAAVGLPVPGSQAQLYLSDRIFTHFERQEDMKNLRGKLHDDLFRIHEILGGATSRSIIIMNEIFSSTSLKDALYLSRKVMERIMELDALCVYVTFIEELSTLSPQTVSMLSEVKPDAIASRTFRVVRHPADGRSYAMTLARQYGLTYERLKERIGS
ncbi:MutS-related protein [Caballeronia sp. J97]|uniref:MutS-related protein n=1 Tax=Caballeronia sp. J97 TaxID=2805429 RepID=UPI002AB1EB41|nr:DNA mismatch repair protein MutS [Caballeronia sp. J97]